MRAPWRWKWGSILGRALLWAVIWNVVQWCPVMAVPVALWFVAWVIAGTNEPRSPRVVTTPSKGEKAGHRVVRSGNGALTIVYREDENVRTEVKR